MTTYGCRRFDSRNCTASFVSPEGLILTNHHCVESCLAELSSKDKSLVELGYAAAGRGAELRCPAQLADVLVGTENITDAVSKAIAGLERYCGQRCAQEDR